MMVDEFIKKAFDVVIDEYSNISDSTRLEIKKIEEDFLVELKKNIDEWIEEFKLNKKWWQFWK